MGKEGTTQEKKGKIHTQGPRPTRIALKPNSFGLGKQEKDWYGLCGDATKKGKEEKREGEKKKKTTAIVRFFEGY